MMLFSKYILAKLNETKVKWHIKVTYLALSNMPGSMIAPEHFHLLKLSMNKCYPHFSNEETVITRQSEAAFKKIKNSW